MSDTPIVLITGATGLVGKALLEQLPNAFVATRNRAGAVNQLSMPQQRVIGWDPVSGPIQLPPDCHPDCVVNLMGESVAEGRWNAAKKKRIRDSRVTGTANLVAGLVQCNAVPRVLISASAVGFYGDRGEEKLDESAAAGTGFLADVCRQWEAAAMSLAAHGSRVACVRISIVLARYGGALPQLASVFKWGVGGPLGSGKQWFPWIHLDDLVDLILWSIQRNDVSGPLNAAAPESVRNREFTQALAKQLKRPALIPVPKFAARLALGEFADNLFESERVVPRRALDGGFQFRFPNLATALDDLL